MIEDDKYDDRILQIIKDNLQVELSLDRNWEQYCDDKGKPVFDIEVQLILEHSVISKDKITISQ